MSRFLDWLDDRTGVRGLVHEALYERIPGGARWRYVWGSTLVLAFFTQLVTGVFLWMAYSPSTQTAWESVFYIQYEMQGGWLLRGIHHFMAQAMVVLLVLHLLQVVIDGAYRAPREVNFWIGLILMQIVLGLSLTGYLLPWDEKGYWATQVSTNLVGMVPLVGEQLMQLVVGGSDYGHHTLTRFFALHAGVLPGLLILMLIAHIALFRRHGLHATDPKRAPATTFWPDQVLRDGVASLAVLAVVLGLVVWRGADLGAPADPASSYAAARPEWYFLFLFQFLKFFSGDYEVYGAIVVPGLAVLVLAAMPLVGRWRLGHRFNVAFLLIVLLGAGLLTLQAWHDDHYADLHAYDPDKFADDREAKKAYDKPFDESREFLDAVKQSEADAERVVELAQMPTRIPPGGALAMVRNDAKIQGARLFKLHCGSCHNYVDLTGRDTSRDIVNLDPSAPNLYGFATREWIAGLLNPEKITGPHYFGYQSVGDDGERRDSPFLAGDMVSFVNDMILDVDDADKAEIQEQVGKVVMALSAQAALKSQAEMDQQDAEAIAEGAEIIQGEAGDLSCIDCHKFGDSGDLGMAPDLTGYGSRQWLIDFISDPSHERFYGSAKQGREPGNDRMPAFGDGLLTEKSLGQIVDWLRTDWVEPEPPESSD